MGLRSTVVAPGPRKGTHALLGGNGANLRTRGPAGCQAPQAGWGKATACPCQTPRRWRTVVQTALLRHRDRPGLAGAEVRAGALGRGDHWPTHGPERELGPGK